MNQQVQRGSLPANVADLAAREQLSNLVGQYNYRFGGTVFWSILGIIFGVILILSISLGISWSSLVLALIGLLILFISGWRLWAAMIFRGTRVYLYKEGIIRSGRSTVEAINWDRTREVLKLTMVRVFYGASMNQYILRRAEGEREGQVAIDRGFNKFKQLGETIEREMLPRLLPAATAAYDAGQTLKFGSATLSLQGVTFNNGKRVVSWPEINYLNLAQGQILLNWRAQGHKLASSEQISMNDIPNAFVFLALIQNIRASQKQQQG